MSANNKLGWITKPSIMRRVFFAFTAVGIVIGVVFPMVAQSMVVVPPGMKTIFHVACIGAGLLLALISVAIVNVLVMGKMSHVLDMAKALGNGDLRQRSEFKSNDVIGEIIEHMNNAAERLRNAFDEISESSLQLEDAAQRLHRISDETDSCLQDQQNQAEQVATAMNEMTSTVQEVARHAESAADAATEAHRQARDGALIATEAIGGITALISKVEQAADVLSSLRSDSDNVGVVLEVIRGIAEQTNLLALNAAIEAARAGEQGRGFAVVADEVRTLASRTQQSTQEIQQIIEKLQDKAVSAVEVMNQVRQKGEENGEQVERAAEALAEIAGSVSTVDNMNTQIASASEEQRSVAEEINQRVHQIHEATEQTAAGTQQTASASDQLNQLVGRLRMAVGDFRVH